VIRRGRGTPSDGADIRERKDLLSRDAGVGTTSFTDAVGQVSGSFCVGVPTMQDLPEITARFRDPAGNVMGLYQERSLSS